MAFTESIFAKFGIPQRHYCQISSTDVCGSRMETVEHKIKIYFRPKIPLFCPRKALDLWDMIPCELVCTCWRSEGVVDFVFGDFHEERDACFALAKIFLESESVESIKTFKNFFPKISVNIILQYVTSSLKRRNHLHMYSQKFSCLS